MYQAINSSLVQITVMVIILVPHSFLAYSSACCNTCRPIPPACSFGDTAKSPKYALSSSFLTISQHATSPELASSEPDSGVEVPVDEGVDLNATRTKPSGSVILASRAEGEMRSSARRSASVVQPARDSGPR
ncbi:hypothetical protein NXS19_000202 [Fusarium pseudograminearum]|nr:hypothetical protein NXS19_000202 [Fusarium pseudograminearum]